MQNCGTVSRLGVADPASTLSQYLSSVHPRQCYPFPSIMFLSRSPNSGRDLVHPAFVEMRLGVPESAVNRLVQLLSLLRFWIAAVVHAHQPGAAAAADDLSNSSYQRETSIASQHTNGTLRRAI